VSRGQYQTPKFSRAFGTRPDCGATRGSSIVRRLSYRKGQHDDCRAVRFEQTRPARLVQGEDSGSALRQLSWSARCPRSPRDLGSMQALPHEVAGELPGTFLGRESLGWLCGLSRRARVCCQEVKEPWILYPWIFRRRSISKRTLPALGASGAILRKVSNSRAACSNCRLFARTVPSNRCASALLASAFSNS